MKIMINKTQTLLEIADTWPISIDFFKSNGFSQFNDKEKLKIFGATVTLEQALKVKK